MACGQENITAVNIDRSMCTLETDVGTPSHHNSLRLLCVDTPRHLQGEWDEFLWKESLEQCCPDS